MWSTVPAHPEPHAQDLRWFFMRRTDGGWRQSLGWLARARINTSSCGNIHSWDISIIRRRTIIRFFRFRTAIAGIIGIITTMVTTFCLHGLEVNGYITIISHSMASQLWKSKWKSGSEWIHVLLYTMLHLTWAIYYTYIYIYELYIQDSVCTFWTIQMHGMFGPCAPIFVGVSSPPQHWCHHICPGMSRRVGRKIVLKIYGCMEVYCEFMSLDLMDHFSEKLHKMMHKAKTSCPNKTWHRPVKLGPKWGTTPGTPDPEKNQ